MADENKVSHPEIKLYIHEHLSPWGERIGRMEEIIARHDKDIEDIGNKIGESHENVIRTIKTCRDEMAGDIKAYGKEITVVKNWIRSLVMAGIGLTAIIAALNHFGVLGGS